ADAGKPILDAGAAIRDSCVRLAEVAFQTKVADPVKGSRSSCTHTEQKAFICGDAFDRVFMQRHSGHKAGFASLQAKNQRLTGVGPDGRMKLA
ncbi:hypothetical protein, partial [Pseudomonas viridiflava]|uniref:hypothetical protein n=1 Tax=Pseudomonas viridiflava TaxID=33069 RepID=UPI00197E152E